MALCTPYICTNIILAAAAPPTKKLKKEKKSKVEKAMEKTFDMFMKSQADAEERFQMREDERWKEMEMEEGQRREDREHQLQMMQMLQSRPYSSQYGFDYDP